MPRHFRSHPAGGQHDNGEARLNWGAMVSLLAFWTEFSARRTLARLHEQLGAGLLAASALPALSATIDQHAAAVRDIVAMGVEGSAAVAGVVLLAGYARGVVDQAAELGWRFTPPVDAGAWANADWFTSRLLAVCALVEQCDQPARADVNLGRPATEQGY
jgi:Family of unknown function (DUF6401)